MPWPIRRFLQDDRGATAIEYGLIAALVSGAAIAALQSLGQSVAFLYDYVNLLADRAVTVRP